MFLRVCADVPYTKGKKMSEFYRTANSRWSTVRKRTVQDLRCHNNRREERDGLWKLFTAVHPNRLFSAVMRAYDLSTAAAALAFRAAQESSGSCKLSRWTRAVKVFDGPTYSLTSGANDRCKTLLCPTALCVVMFVSSWMRRGIFRAVRTAARHVVAVGPSSVHNTR